MLVRLLLERNDEVEMARAAKMPTRNRRIPKSRAAGTRRAALTSTSWTGSGACTSLIPAHLRCPKGSSHNSFPFIAELPIDLIHDHTFAEDQDAVREAE